MEAFLPPGFRALSLEIRLPLNCTRAFWLQSQANVESDAPIQRKIVGVLARSSRAHYLARLISGGRSLESSRLDMVYDRNSSDGDRRSLDPIGLGPQPRLLRRAGYFKCHRRFCVSLPVQNSDALPTAAHSNDPNGTFVLGAFFH